MPKRPSELDDLVLLRKESEELHKELKGRVASPCAPVRCDAQQGKAGSTSQSGISAT